MHDLETASGHYTQESWAAVAQRHGRSSGYCYRRASIKPAAGQHPEAYQAWRQGRPIVTTVQPETEDSGQAAIGALAVPITLRDQVIGVLDLRSEGETVSPEMVALVKEVAGRLALALENARLLEEAQQRAHEEHLLGEVTARIRAPMDVDTILQTAVRELGQAMGVDRVSVYLAPEEEVA